MTEKTENKESKEEGIAGKGLRLGERGQPLRE